MKTAFESFIEPARTRFGVWRPIVGLGCIAIGVVIWIVVVLIGFLILPALHGMPLRAALDVAVSMSTSFDSMGIIFQCFLFLGVWPSVWLAVTFIHAQRFSTLFAPMDSFRPRDFFAGLLLAIMLWLAETFLVVVVYGLPDRTTLTLSSWTIALLPMIVGLMIQAGAEELVFRGYLLQQLAARWRNPIAWAGVTSVLFIFIHKVTGDYIYIAFLFTFGLVSAVLVWRTGSLLTSIGLHFGVNLLIINGIGYKWSEFDQSQLFLFQGADRSFRMIFEIVAMILLLLFVVSPFFPQRQSAR